MNKITEEMKSRIIRAEPQVIQNLKSGWGAPISCKMAGIKWEIARHILLQNPEIMMLYIDRRKGIKQKMKDVRFY